MNIYFSRSFDDSLADQIQSVLAKKGVDSTSGNDLASGADFRQSVLTAIKEADGVVVLQTQGSRHVDFECGVAAGANKPILIVSDGTSIPFELRMYPIIPAFLEVDEIAFSIMKWAQDFIKVRVAKPEVELRDELRSALMSSTLSRFSNRMVEELIVDALNRAGVEAKLMSESRDHRYDIEATYKPIGAFAIEVKALPSGAPASISHVERLSSQKVVQPGIHCLLVSPSGFTPAAIAVSRSVGVSLAGVEELLALLDGDAKKFLLGSHHDP